MTRAMGHSPNGQDPQGLGAKPEWPGLAKGEMRPASSSIAMTQRNLTMTAMLEKLRETKGPATLWLEGVADEVLAMRVPRRSAALRAEPVALSQAKPAAAIASFCEHGVQTFLLCYDCEDERCKCGYTDPLDPYYQCAACERQQEERYAEDERQGLDGQADGQPLTQVGPNEPSHAPEGTAGGQSGEGARLSEALSADETSSQGAGQDDQKARLLLVECPECGGAGWVVSTDAECCGRSEYECGGRGCEGPYQVQVQDQCEFCGGNGKLPASVDTHPKDGDVKQAPLVSGAVPHEDEADAQTPKSVTKGV